MRRTAPPTARGARSLETCVAGHASSSSVSGCRNVTNRSTPVQLAHHQAGISIDFRDAANYGNELDNYSSQYDHTLHEIASVNLQAQFLKGTTHTDRLITSSLFSSGLLRKEPLQQSEEEKRKKDRTQDSVIWQLRTSEKATSPDMLCRQGFSFPWRIFTFRNCDLLPLWRLVSFKSLSF